MSILDLAPELQRLTAQHLSNHDLFNLSLSCRQMHRVLVLILYENIDLNSYVVDQATKAIRKAEPPRSDQERYERAQSKQDKALYTRQKALIRTLREKPELALGVRSLRWSTVFDESWTIDADFGSDEYMALMSKRDFKYTVSRADSEDHFNACNDVLWWAFGLMKNVTTVDLNFVSNTTRREETPPPPLFAKAQSVTLSGIASRFLVVSLLESCNPQGLRYLHLNNIQQFQDWSGVPEDIPLWKKSQITADHRKRLYELKCGCMRTHLSRMKGQWSQLRSLIIDTSSTGTSDRAARGVDPETEHLRYKEMGDFLRSVSHTLEHLRFEHGRPPPGGRRMTFRCGNGRRAWAMRMWEFGIAWPPPISGAMQAEDVHFARHILPAILESPWPNLKTLEIYGVGSSSRSEKRGNDDEVVMVKSPLGDDVLGQIRAAASGLEHLVLEPEATRFFWMAGDIHDTGIGYGFGR
ncbi:hypothetical protein HJFPF1_11914 [Paramyrothecium foliicola]|nr:hypothetical protein HJFPF1_11914 [Paramyrothecium foliicola]